VKLGSVRVSDDLVRRYEASGRKVADAEVWCVDFAGCTDHAQALRAAHVKLKLDIGLAPKEAMTDGFKVPAERAVYELQLTRLIALVDPRFVVPETV
jgi:hypothetical protein